MNEPIILPPVAPSRDGELFGGPFDGCILVNWMINRSIGYNVPTDTHTTVPFEIPTIVSLASDGSSITVYDARRRTAAYAHDGNRWTYVKPGASS